MERKTFVGMARKIMSDDVKAIIKYAEEKGIVFDWNKECLFWGMVLMRTDNLCKWLDLYDDMKTVKYKIDVLIRESERMAERKE